MAHRVTQEQLTTALDDLSFPVVRSDAAVELSETVVVVGGNEFNLGELVSDADSDTYQSREDLVDEINEMLANDAE